MRVCYFGTYRAEYSRNQIMIEGLRRNGVEVIECHAALWQGIEDRVQAASGGWRRPAFWGRVLKTYSQLLRQYRQVGAYDVLVVGYPGQFDIFLARLLTWLRRKPLAWDVFMSIYLIALERNLPQRSRFTCAVIRWVEKIACRLPDRLILDTTEYVAWFERTHGVAADRFRLVPTGADDRSFIPQELPPFQDHVFKVMYYGTFIRNHGVDTIIEAAHLLAQNKAIQFELIGTGPERPLAEALAKAYELSNVTFVDWLEQPALVARSATADICLGAFGDTPQSVMTVQNKIYEGLALGRPVITGDSPAVRQALQHGEHVYLCARQDARALAEAILTLHARPELCAAIARQGQQLFQEQFALLPNGRRFKQHLAELIAPPGAPA